MDSRRVMDLLKNYESRNVTFVDPDGSWPVVWKRARGVHVWDQEGRRYTDFTSATPWGTYILTRLRRNWRVN